jgi:hypothetical protein
VETKGTMLAKQTSMTGSQVSAYTTAKAGSSEIVQRSCTSETATLDPHKQCIRKVAPYTCMRSVLSRETNYYVGYDCYAY